MDLERKQARQKQLDLMENATVPMNNSGIFDRTQTQFERKQARQKQLEMMEAAASGQDSSSSMSGSGGIRSPPERSLSGGAPEGAIESARRFLWDEDEEDPALSTGGTYPHSIQSKHQDYYNSGDHQNIHLMAANAFNQPAPAAPRKGLLSRGGGDKESSHSASGSLFGTLLSVFSRNRSKNLDADVDASGAPLEPNLAPRRQQPQSSSNWNDAQPRKSESEEYLGKAPDGPVGFCFGIMSSMAMCCSVLLQFVTSCLGSCNMRLCCIILGGLIGLLLLTFGIVAIILRADSGPVVVAPASAIQDEVRYQALRHVVLESTFTSKPVLDTPGTAQNLALRWLTDDDPGQLETDDDAILQRYALATFYFSTYVASELDDQNRGSGTLQGGWTYMDFWMSDKGICLWFGVTCPTHLKEGVEETHYNENSDVMRLNLTMNNIRGTIPSELVALENMVSLDLGKNKLHGTIPKSLANLKELRELYLNENELGGQIPSQLGNLLNCRDFFVGTNKLTGQLPAELAQLTELRAIGLDENLLTGKVPDAFWNLDKLLILYLDSNQLSGTLPAEMARMTELMDLRLRKNFFTGTIPGEIQQMTHLELLYLDDNDLTGSIPDVFEQLNRVQEIQIYKNKLTGTLPESVSTLKDLRVLYADNNQLSGSLPSSYGSLGDMHTMYAFNNKLTGTIPSEIGQILNLKDFQLYNNALTGYIPWQLGNCYKLEKIELQDNQLTGEVPKSLGGLENLEILKLYRNLFQGDVPNSICDAKEKFTLNFLAADCNADAGGTLGCGCCNACYP